MSTLNAHIPEGPIAEKWTKHKAKIPLVSPANKRQIDVIVVGTGLAGSSAAASLAFCTATFLAAASLTASSLAALDASTFSALA